MREIALSEMHRNVKISYLVGGLRISLHADTRSPGPRTHILSMVSAWRNLGSTVVLNVASTFPLLGRFTRIRQSDLASVGRGKLAVADLVRMGCGIWAGLVTFYRTSRESRPGVIYERVAVFQSLTSFHRYKRKAVRIVEANGILSREAAHDRNGLRFERIAAFIEKRVLRRADVVVAVSTPLARELQRFAGLDDERILVVPNAAETSLTESPVTRSTDGPIVVGFLGSLAAWHHIPDLIRSLASSWTDLEGETSGRGLELRIVGDGGDRPAIEKAISETGMGDRISMLGMLPRTHALRECAMWDIGIAAHNRSTSAEMYHSPLKLYEYAALGMAIVATPSLDADSLRSDGIPIYSYDGPAEFTDAVGDSVRFAMRQSPEEIEAIREQVRRKHTWERRAEYVLERAYQLAAARSGRAE